MRPIIFVRIADMKYYKGITDNDRPVNGGSFVNETGMAHECYNFESMIQSDQDYEKCLGYFRSNGSKTGQLHIEKMPGCTLLKKEDSVDGVTVVFVSKAVNSKTMRVVGFYKNATAYRYPRIMTFGNGYEQEYNFEAKKEDCVLLPYQTRFEYGTWYVPNSSSKNASFGFGRSNVWFSGGKGASDKEVEYVEKMLNSIDKYTGENWIDKGGEN